ncbi:pseudouridine synthase [Lyngbya confervoides]|uniref:pseudouridine synthase n=1 Tax=Lyngbya confervoides TaxID=207921 RepID=UPI0032D5A35B
MRPTQTPWTYLLFYKPYNVLSQFSDSQLASCQTLRHYIDTPGVYPVGRLDRDSEGLMLLTNHGWMQHRICDPKFRHPRTYWAQVERIPTPEALTALRQGIVIKGGQTRPAQVEFLDPAPSLPPRQPPIRFRKQVPTAWIALTLREGKNRQVRRMTAAVGFPTLRLVRVAIGPLRLDGLRPGQSRPLSEDELIALQRFVGRPPSPSRRSAKGTQSSS